MPKMRAYMANCFAREPRQAVKLMHEETPNEFLNRHPEITGRCRVPICGCADADDSALALAMRLKMHGVVTTDVMLGVGKAHPGAFDVLDFRVENNELVAVIDIKEGHLGRLLETGIKEKRVLFFLTALEPPSIRAAITRMRNVRENMPSLLYFFPG